MKAAPAPDPDEDALDEDALIAVMSGPAEREIYEIQAIGWAIDALSYILHRQEPGFAALWCCSPKADLSMS